MGTPATTITTLALALVTGCAVPRRPIEDLYAEAIDASRERREAADRIAAGARDVAACNPAMSLAEPEAPDTSPRVSDVLVDADVREALVSLGLQAGLEVVVDGAVEGRVCARLDDVPFETALSTLLPAGVVWGRTGRQYLVTLADPTSSSFAAIARSEVYRPRHTPAVQLLPLLPPDVARFVRVSPERNVLVFNGPPATLRRIRAELAALDVRVPELEIEAIVCELSPYEGLETGFDFEHGVPLPGGKAGAINLQSLAAGGAIAPGGELGTQTFEFYSAFVRLLASEGYVSIRAAPRVRVQDGAPAQILIGDLTYFTPSQDANQVFRELRTIETGIVLELSARVQGGGDIAVRIDRAEVSDELRPTSLVPSPDGSLPTVSTRRVKTSVTLQDGATVVLGGLVRRRLVERSVSIPVLGDVPLLGELFRRRDQREEETEVAIFLTARIVQ